MNRKRDRFKLRQATAAFIFAKLLRMGVTGALLSSMLTAGESLILSKSTAHAQAVPAVTTDNTTDTQVQNYPNFFLVTGGTVKGKNLFHSFETFSPETAYTQFWLGAPNYAGAANGVTNIFSRVTGSEASTLNGVLQVVGGSNPNFFLLNPNGVLIGPNAFISIPGSFFVSTAESILFDG
ncbi:MAG: filamentous hemagglutinin N-terminal domain-containing protein, partial [Phormidesmis sp.]